MTWVTGPETEPAEQMLTMQQTMTVDRHGAAQKVTPKEALPLREPVEFVISRALGGMAELQQLLKRPPVGLVDCLAATGDEPHRPEEIFRRLRWGGLFLFVSGSRRQVRGLAREFPKHGFILERGPAAVREGFLPLLSRKVHYFVARKMLLIPPGTTTDRFTYDVRLVHYQSTKDSIVVQKEVPSFESVMQRLRQRVPDVADEVLRKRARKFTEKVFPTFLTREAAILMILQDYLPEPYKRRVPRVIDLEKDERGFVRKLRMNWLRNGGEPLPQIEFARQAADLLRVIHDVGNVIHLDLRLDNFVITEEGVGFVDFGSSVRADEDLQENPLLGALFEELMRTSQIQRMLEKMTLSGAVTSHAIREGHRKVDKAVDFFYLALQFNAPHANPDLAGLIEYDPQSSEAQALARLTEQILKPADPANPAFRSAKDILHGVERIQLGLDSRR